MSVQIKGVGTIGGIDQGLDTVGVVTATSFVGTGVSVVGVVTATSFSGSGANLTSLPVQVTLNNNADNRVITGGSGVNLYAESGFTFDGTDVQIPDKILLNTAGTYVKSNQLQFKPSGTAYIDHATTGQDIQIRMSTSSSLDTTGPTFKSNGNLAFASGKGIDFSATANSSVGTMSSELLDDYEEGSWTPILTGYSGGNTQTYAVQVGSYTKIGREVTAHFEVKLSNKGNISGSYTLIQGLPYNHAGSRAGSGTINFFSNLNSNISSMGLEGGGGISDSFWVTSVNSTGNTGMSYINTSNISNSTNIVGTLHYRVS